ncbi:MAG: FAD-binding protein, partial [Verrucomicrobiota bacterium]|nr:FAD-binding protein [Verrucomicrobiota bacterium]
SPVRIPRDASSLQHPGVVGLFPCGEGAGYAGGIVSAALDGRKCAEAVEKLVR